MSFVTRPIIQFWSGTSKKAFSNRHPAPWPNPSRPRFRPTPPTTFVGKVKSYIPGRRWLIFGGVIISWIALAAYDKRQRKAVVARWCKKVEHLSRREIKFDEDIPSIGVWISAPPGDQLKWNKEVWRDYVKPIIVAAGFDYSLHLNPRQGLTRSLMREMILQHRLHRERSGDHPLPREKEGGDIIVVGRNTFKEVVRGIHEGYLSPPDPPPSERIELEKPEVEPELVQMPIPTSQYMSLDDPSPSAPEYTFTYVPSLHILGLRHTPRRIYRFLTRRYIAEGICEQVAACILDQPQREWAREDYRQGETEENYWPKTVLQDCEWREEIVVDPRLQSRLLWRRAYPVEEMPDYRDASAPEDMFVRMDQLVQTEEESNREQMQPPPKSSSNPFQIPNPLNHRQTTQMVDQNRNVD